ncbi:MAG: hypothetical protein AB1631_07395 [Acidobacteriota bacterium]
MHRSETISINSADERQNADILLHKDAVLDHLSQMANVAQFVSFGPRLDQRYSRIRGYEPNHQFETIERAIEALLNASPDGRINIRSYTPQQPKSRQFLYGLQNIDEVVSGVCRLGAEGLHTIINETIDVNDGGVSGVVIGDLLEFAPGDTPRCVEKAGTVSLPREIGLQLLEKVYGFRPLLDYDPALRIEFSIHPLRRGHAYEHTIIWELEEVGPTNLNADIRWPNLFSRHIGDKAFGLLVADLLDLPVPATTVIPRFVAPFRLGRPTGTGEVWIRTCPVEQVPGLFTTQRGWRDPFLLLAEEDPQGIALASVLAQEGVEASYSGALLATPDGSPIIEGVRGSGDEFMIGHAAPEILPDEVLKPVRQLYERVVSQLGPIRFEWVHDGKNVWVVQLHRGATATSGSAIYPGEASFYHRFEVSSGIESLRRLVHKVQGTGEGIVLVGDVGITSHLGDLLRKARIPSRLERIHQYGS